MVNKKTIKDILKTPEAELLIDYICKRKRQGFYSLILVGGHPGSGKTRTCVRCAEKIQERLTGNSHFDCTTNIVDNFIDLVKFVKDAKSDELNVCIIEEVGVLFPSRRSMATANVDISKVLDTCRKKEVILFANAPIYTSIDSHIRALANSYIQTLRIYKTGNLVYSKFYRLQTDPRSGKTYNPHFKRNGRRIRFMYTLKSNEEEWIKYEKSKDEFMDNLYEKLIAIAMKKEKREQKLLLEYRPVNIGKFTKRELEFVRLKGLGLNQTEIAKEMGITFQRVSKIKQNIEENRGFTKENA